MQNEVELTLNIIFILFFFFSFLFDSYFDSVHYKSTVHVYHVHGQMVLCIMVKQPPWHLGDWLWFYPPTKQALRFKRLKGPGPGYRPGLWQAWLSPGNLRAYYHASNRRSTVQILQVQSGKSRQAHQFLTSKPVKYGNKKVRSILFFKGLPVCLKLCYCYYFCKGVCLKLRLLTIFRN